MKRRIISWSVVAIFIAIFLIVNHQSRMDPSGRKNRETGPGLSMPPQYLTPLVGPAEAASNEASEADVVTAAVTLEWNTNSEPNLAGYRLYHGPAAGTYPESIPTTSTMITVASMTPGTVKHFAVSAVNIPGLESALSADLAYQVPGGESTPPPTPLPTAPPTPAPTAAPTPLPTAPPTPTPPPVSPTATPGIILNPVTLNFTGVVGGPWPSPKSIQVTTSNGAAWTSLDTSNWFDTGQWNHGSSGDSCVLTPHTQGMVAGTYSDPIKFSATGLPPKTITVTLTLAPKPTPTPVRTPTPSPTAVRTPSPSPTCTPCLCGNRP